MTNKQAMDALVDIGRVQANPKLAGALTAKIFDNLNESGIIDNEYITEVNNRLKVTQEPTESEAPATPTAPQQDFLQFLRQE
jgi:hypothetical protein